MDPGSLLVRKEDVWLTRQARRNQDWSLPTLRRFLALSSGDHHRPWFNGKPCGHHRASMPRSLDSRISHPQYSYPGLERGVDNCCSFDERRRVTSNTDCDSRSVVISAVPRTPKNNLSRRQVQPIPQVQPRRNSTSCMLGNSFVRRHCQTSCPSDKRWGVSDTADSPPLLARPHAPAVDPRPSAPRLHPTV